MFFKFSVPCISVFSLSILLTFVMALLVLPEAATSKRSRFTNETDEQSLISIRDQIQADPYDFFASWHEKSYHFCNWAGVECSLKHQRVIVLNLSSQQLGGPVSPYIGNLTFLHSLILDNNSFSGSIPQEIGKLWRLRHFSVFSNYLEGQIPETLSRCVELRVINLGRNRLKGEVPGKLSSLLKVQELDLSENRFSGKITSSLGNLSSLQMLSLSGNFLEGTVPAELSRLSKLEYLDLSSNKLYGVILPQISNLSSIKHLMLASNKFSGTFPENLGLILQKLHTVLVSRNVFTGYLPASIANASALSIFDVSENSIAGPVPSTWGSLKYLQRLELGGNPLGSNNGDSDFNFISSLVNCTGLRSLHLNHNNLRGVLPDSVANLTTGLTSLRLEENYLSGAVPEGIGNLVSLFNLSLSENSLTGTLPDSIGKLVRLEGLYLSGNNFIGSIPLSLGNITFLSILDMQENLLDGDLSVFMGNFTRLGQLNLSFNKLRGDIPGKIMEHGTLVSLNLAHNLLSGSLPLEIGYLENLVRLDVSNNKIRGLLSEINLWNCLALQFLNLQGNAFEGFIPETFRGLRSIKILDLSENNLSGKIPNFLSNFSEIKYVNLSYNMLEGEVPNEGVFTNLKAFSVAGNPKLCGVVASTPLPACLEKKHTKKAINYKKIMIICGVGSLTLLLLGVAYFFSIHRWIRSMVLELVSFFGTWDTQTEESREELSVEKLLGKQYPKVSYEQLLQATDNFSADKLVGKGRYGTVYKGVLNTISEKTLAVKVINLQRHGAIKSFVSECETLRNVRHRNIIKIITSCSGGIGFDGTDFKALVYEYMPNGSLESWLHPEPSAPRSMSLSLIQRLSIAIDIATALDYLHNFSNIPVIHRDIKPSNILLDGDLCAHLGDFGSARSLLIPSVRSAHIRIPQRTIGIIGTIGYVALEYGMGGPVSTLVDVYSFGIVILEMLTGKRPTSRMFRDDFSLHNYVKMHLPDQVAAITDPRLLLPQEGENVHGSSISSQTRIYTASFSGTEECLASLLRIGVRCSAQLPTQRMEISDALMQLHSIRDIIFMRSSSVPAVGRAALASSGNWCRRQPELPSISVRTDRT